MKKCQWRIVKYYETTKQVSSKYNYTNIMCYSGVFLKNKKCYI